jgi:hypothetical protein
MNPEWALTTTSREPHPAEFVHLQREYALSSPRMRNRGIPEPMALLGFSQHENLYLVEGRWDADHVPISVQRQPFLIGLEERLINGVPSQVPACPCGHGPPEYQ